MKKFWSVFMTKPSVKFLLFTVFLVALVMGFSSPSYAVQISNIQFSSGGTTIRGLHYLPDSTVLKNADGIPCVVMAHGFGLTLKSGLEPFAKRFAEAGMHVVLFDYRHFGSSNGNPRQLLSIQKQLADWQAAIQFARTLSGVDDSRIALWGTSFSGGHVVEAAVTDGRVAAVVSQCPLMDGGASLIENALDAGLLSAELIFRAKMDVRNSLFGLPPVMTPIAANPGRLGMMSAPDVLPGYMSIAGPDFKNEVCARLALELGTYYPGYKAGLLNCPILIQIANYDSVCPPWAAEAAGERAGDLAKVIRYDIGHFDFYTGANFERSVTDQMQFLTDALLR